MISLRNVSAGYHRKQVLVGLNLDLGAGLTFVVGENGAGKTTLFRVLLGLLKPTSGTIHVSGRELSRASRGATLRQIGYLPQAFRTPAHLSLGDFLSYMAMLKLVPRSEITPRARAAATKVGLEDLWGTPLGSLSGGMMRRAGIAQALVDNPAIVLLDEPTVGLDPTSRVDFRRLVAELAKETTILLSTHLLEDATVMGGTLVALRQGAIVHAGPTKALLDRIDPDGGPAGATALESAFMALIGGGGVGLRVRVRLLARGRHASG